MKYFIVLLTFFLFLSCDDNPSQDGACSPKCDNWKTCDSSTKECKLKENMCDSKSDCADNLSCNENHECILERDTHCDDQSELTCKMMMPTCKDGYIPSVIENCWKCLDKVTCKEKEERDTHCDDSTELTCNTVKPDCENGTIPSIIKNCWICLDKETCKEPRDETCDDGTEITCKMDAPNCEDYEILSYQDNCYLCVNKLTCLPWGKSSCKKDKDCDDNKYCNSCATSSSPDLTDCIAACTTHNCTTEEKANCKMLRPECGENFAIVKDGCWECVDSLTCNPIDVRDETCDDGTEITCKSVTPDCEDYEILSYQNNCYLCVNKLTCLPWGKSSCKKDKDCDDNKYCDSCATSSSPGVTDCIAACVAHDCTTQDEATCEMVRPECGDEFAVVKDNCWVCVDSVTCNEIIPRDTSCDDGSNITCENQPPHCEDYNILAYKDNCYYCVDPTTCEPSECHFDYDCNDNTWDIRCMGHWSCKRGVCDETCDPEGCGNGICSSNEGETVTSCSPDCKCGNNICDTDETPENCPIDCDALACDTVADCLDKTWESLDGHGHWECFSNSCYEIVSGDTDCGNDICNPEGGESTTSCPADCR